MTITARIIADSVSPKDVRITTLQLRYPRFIHAEFMTHRDFSRNASSSRAIPVRRLIRDVRRDPAMPVHWGSNKPGMQAGDELKGFRLWLAKKLWLCGMWTATSIAGGMVRLGLHKQIANRIIEPWTHINVVVTATNWDNFFHLRRHADAQPEIKALADKIHKAMKHSDPVPLAPGEWHLPYVGAAWEQDGQKGRWVIVDGGRYLQVTLDQAKKISVARCARVSYMTHDGEYPSITSDMALYSRLVGSEPLHASPAEHQATPDTMTELTWDCPDKHGNFKGWIQYRKTLPGECCDSYQEHEETT